MEIEKYFEKPLTLAELCDFLRGKESTLRQYCREGMPHFFVGKECRFIPAKCLEWLERRSQYRVCPQNETIDLRKEMQS